MIPQIEVLKKLEEANKHIQNAKSDSLLQKISKFLTVDLSLLDILELEFKKEKEQDVSELYEKANDLIEKMHDDNKQIEEHCKKNNILVPESVYNFYQYYGEKNNLIESLTNPFLAFSPWDYQNNPLLKQIKHNESYDALDHLVKELRNSVLYLLDMEKISDDLKKENFSFLKTIAIIDEEAKFRSLLMAEELIDYYYCKQELDQNKLEADWYKFQLLKLVLNEYESYKKLTVRFEIERGGQFTDDYKCDSFKILDQIKSGQQKELIIFLKGSCQSIFDRTVRVYNLNLEDDKKQEIKHIFRKYDANEGVLYIGAYKIEFPKKNSAVRKILQIITYNIDALHKEWTYRGMKDALRKKTSKNSLRSSYVHIHEQILKQSNGEIKDFFGESEISYDSLQINSKYLA